MAILCVYRSRYSTALPKPLNVFFMKGHQTFFIQMVTKIFPFVKARPLFTGTRKGQAASGNDAVHVIRSKGLRTEEAE